MQGKMHKYADFFELKSIAKRQKMAFPPQFRYTSAILGNQLRQKPCKKAIFFVFF